MIARILVALDGSPRAPGVLAKASEIAARFGARLHPLRAIFVSPEFPAAAAGSRADPLPARLAQDAREDVTRIIARAGTRGVATHPPIIRIGQPWKLILEVGDEIDADLIVIGSHGYGGLDRILGTTASRVSNLALRDVLVVHDRPERRLSLDLPRAPYR
jgi:nucleotide-binding universal stress UspA family protein